MDNEIYNFIPLGDQNLVYDVIIEVLNNNNFNCFHKIMQHICNHYINDRKLIYSIYEKIFQLDNIELFNSLYGSDIRTFHVTMLFEYAVQENAINIVQHMFPLIIDKNYIKYTWIIGIGRNLFKNDWDDSKYIPIVDIILSRIGGISLFQMIELIHYRANNVFKHLLPIFINNFNEENFFEMAIACIKYDNIEILKYLYENKYYDIDEKFIEYIKNSTSKNLPLRVIFYAKNIVKTKSCVELIYCANKRDIYLTAENIEDLISYMV